jgi:hypothetical protein
MLPNEGSGLWWLKTHARPRSSNDGKNMEPNSAADAREFNTSATSIALSR